MSYHAEITRNSCGSFQESIESLKKKEQEGVLLLRNKPNVFARIEIESPGIKLSPGFYNFLIGIILFWGFFINWLIAKNIGLFYAFGINNALLLIISCSLCLTGFLFFKNAIGTLSSFIGYNFILVPFWFAINALTYSQNSNLSIEASKAIGFVIIVLTCFSTIFPKFFEKISGSLVVTISALAIVGGIEILILENHHELLSWLLVTGISCYVGIDWGRANRIPKTIDNAVECAAALYVDLINLFFLALPTARKK